MGASTLVYVLVLVSYNSITQQFETFQKMSYHISASDCIQERTFQNDRGRRETFNRKYQCVPVYDAAMAATLRAAHGNVGGTGYRSGGRIVIELN